MKIALGVDHAAFVYKDAIRAEVEAMGHEIVDCGTNSTESVDYPTIACGVAYAVRDGKADLGILLCGTGIGVSITANKVDGIRAALCHESYTAAMSREHNNANVLCIGARVVGLSLALEIIRTWLTTPWSNNERHARRLRLIADVEKSRVGC
ncbi:MAG TPA: ribose 5-phosphate isomerase B [Armatimonadota bacterium]|nr:ribose 5-phosphate isomerase B [Armatimonadota bacterium]